MQAGATVFVDYAASARIPALVVGGMTVAERVLRDAARAGAATAILRGDAIPPLPALPLGVQRIPAAAPPPAGATPIAGDVIGGVQIVDGDEGRSRRAASRALFQSCRRPYDGLGDRYVTRAISLRITAVLCRLRATPNQVTSVNIGIGFAACAAAARAWFALAGALMALQIILDSCDGELARMRHLHSDFGRWLDNTSDDAIDNLFVAMLGVGLGGPWLVVGVTAAVARGLVALAIHVAVARLGKPGDVLAFHWWFDRDAAATEQLEPRLTLSSVLRSIGRRDLYVLLWAAACIAGAPLAALGLGAAVSATQLGLGVMHLAKR